MICGRAELYTSSLDGTELEQVAAYCFHHRLSSDSETLIVRVQAAGEQDLQPFKFQAGNPLSREANDVENLVGHAHTCRIQENHHAGKILGIFK